MTVESDIAIARAAAATKAAADLRRLNTAIGKLTLPWTTEVTQRIPGKGRRVATITHDPLIPTLRQAVTIAYGGRRSGAAGTGGVLNEIAYQKTRDITIDVYASWRRLIPSAAVFLPLWRDIPLEQVLSVWLGTFRHHQAGGTVTAFQLQTEADRYTKWVDLIELMFDPPTTSAFTGECPQCHKGWIINPDGEYLDAVIIDFASAIATCRACGQVWNGRAGLQHLADTHAPRKLPTDTPANA